MAASLGWVAAATEGGRTRAWRCAVHTESTAPAEERRGGETAAWRDATSSAWREATSSWELRELRELLPGNLCSTSTNSLSHPCCSYPTFSAKNSCLLMFWVFLFVCCWVFVLFFGFFGGREGLFDILY